MDEVQLGKEDRDRFERSLSRMAESLERSSSTMTTSLSDLKKEIAELKEQRYRPYFTSVGLFVAITLAVTGYVYSLESRITQAIFNLQKDISDNAADIRVAGELIDLHAERALARQTHAREREAYIREQIGEGRESQRRLAEEVLRHFQDYHAEPGE